MRKHTQRKAVDYTSTVVRYIQVKCHKLDTINTHSSLLCECFFCVQARTWQRDSRDMTSLQPTPAAAVDVGFLFVFFILVSLFPVFEFFWGFVSMFQMLPPVAYSDNPSTSFAAKFVHSSLNKNRCSINCVLVYPLNCILYCLPCLSVEESNIIVFFLYYVMVAYCDHC